MTATKKTPGKKVPTRRKKEVKKQGLKTAGPRTARGGGFLLVTGAGGFVGRYVVEEALEQGFHVRATDLSGVDLAWADEMGAEVVRGDLTVKEEVKAIVKGVDYVAHMAAAYNLAMPRRKLLRINRDGSMILAEEAAAAGIRHFICCSTADTYGTQKEIPVRETCKQHPENDYAYSKLMAEQAVIRTGARRNMPVTILRPTMIYGPRAVYTASMFCTVPFIVHRRLGFFPHFIGGPLVNAVHAEDVAGAAVYALGRKNMAGHAFNVADDDKQSLSEFYYNIVDPLGVNWPPVPVPILKLPMRWACQLCEAVPGSGFDMLNAMLRLEWSQIVSSLDLVPALSPRFDKGFLSYGLGDHAFDNAKLKATGYRFRRPDFVSGYKDAVRWYRARRWIPEAAQLL